MQSKQSKSLAPRLLGVLFSGFLEKDFVICKSDESVIRALVIVADLFQS